MAKPAFSRNRFQFLLLLCVEGDGDNDKDFVRVSGDAHRNPKILGSSLYVDPLSLQCRISIDVTGSILRRGDSFLPSLTERIQLARSLEKLLLAKDQTGKV